MSREYAEGRIREALRLSKGNATKARQRVIAWTFEDPKLLQALAGPHLTGIVAHAVSRVIYKEETEAENGEAPELPKALDMPPESFGREILTALQSGDTPKFGQESNAPPSRRGQASKSHIDALRQMASKAKSKKPE